MLLVLYLGPVSAFANSSPLVHTDVLGLRNQLGLGLVPWLHLQTSLNLSFLTLERALIGYLECVLSLKCMEGMCPTLLQDLAAMTVKAVVPDVLYQPEV